MWSVKKILEILIQKCLERKHNRLILQLKCTLCGTKKSRFIKEHEAKSLLSNLGTKTPLSKIPLLNAFFL